MSLPLRKIVQMCGVGGGVKEIGGRDRKIGEWAE